MTQAESEAMAAGEYVSVTPDWKITRHVAARHVDVYWRMPDTFIRTSVTAWEPAGAGIRRQILGHGPDLMLVRVEFEAGAVGTLHHHPHRQVSYVAAGRFEVTIDDERTELGVGDCFFVTADRVHGVVAREPGTLIDVFTPAREDFLPAARGAS